VPKCKTNKAFVRAAVNRRQAVELRIAGHSLDEIGDTLGVTKQRAHQYLLEVYKENAELCHEKAEECLQLDLNRVDAIIAALFPKRADPNVANAIAAQMTRRARLLGLDAPEKVETKSQGTLTVEIRRYTLGEGGKYNAIADSQTSRVYELGRAQSTAGATGGENRPSAGPGIQSGGQGCANASPGDAGSGSAPAK
jgi:hypothetical protein